VTANITSFLQFRVQPPTPAGVVPIPKGELRVVNIYPHHQWEKGLVPVLTPRGEIMWVPPDLVEAQQWITVINRKSRGKTKVSPCKVVGASFWEAKTDVTSVTDSGEERIVLAAELNVPLVAGTRSGQSYLKKYDEMMENLLKSTQIQPSNSRSNPWRSKTSFGMPRLSQRIKRKNLRDLITLMSWLNWSTSRPGSPFMSS